MRGEIRDHNGIRYKVLTNWHLFRNRYELLEPYFIRTGFIGYDIETDRVKLTPDGMLCLKAGYTWDGPSGPTVDTKNFMRGSLGHDGKYELFRLGLLPHTGRIIADLELQKDCLKDGMSGLRAMWVFWGVHLFASFAARPTVIMKGV